MLDLIIYTLISLFTDLSGCAPSENVFFGTEKYVEYRPGNTNLIISVPHDGFLKPGNHSFTLHALKKYIIQIVVPKMSLIVKFSIKHPILSNFITLTTFDVKVM